MTSQDAMQVGSWRYSGELSVYNLPSAQPILDELSNFHAVVSGEELIGFCATGYPARVPGLAEHSGLLDIGLGMDPNLIGGGRGTAFGRAVVRYLTELHPAAHSVPWCRAGTNAASG